MNQRRSLPCLFLWTSLCLSSLSLYHCLRFLPLCLAISPSLSHTHTHSVGDKLTLFPIPSLLNNCFHPPGPPPAQMLREVAHMHNTIPPHHLFFLLCPSSHWAQVRREFPSITRVFLRLNMWPKQMPSPEGSCRIIFQEGRKRQRKQEPE